MATRNAERFLDRRWGASRRRPSATTRRSWSTSGPRTAPSRSRRIRRALVKQRGTAMRGVERGGRGRGGRLLALLDSDDHWDPGKLEAQVRRSSAARARLRPGHDPVRAIEPGYRPPGFRPEMMETDHPANARGPARPPGASTRSARSGPSTRSRTTSTGSRGSKTPAGAARSRRAPSCTSASTTATCPTSPPETRTPSHLAAARVGRAAAPGPVTATATERDAFADAVGRAVDERAGFAAGKLGGTEQPGDAGGWRAEAIRAGSGLRRRYGLPRPPPRGHVPGRRGVPARFHGRFADAVRRFDSLGVTDDAPSIDRIVVHHGLVHPVHFEAHEPDRSSPATTRSAGWIICGAGGC